MRNDARANLPPRDAVSVQQAAALLDVHEDTIYRLIAAGRISSFRVGRSVRILTSALRAYQQGL
jgi:excisionase family DNA binding protein